MRGEFIAAMEILCRSGTRRDPNHLPAAPGPSWRNSRADVVRVALDPSPIRRGWPIHEPMPAHQLT